MHFQILSHAGLLIQGAGKSLVFDPWLLGSAYWRSWWNYPPVARNLWENLNPDFILLTQNHWDHFHGVSLRKFSRDTTMLISKSPFGRMKNDLVEMGFFKIVELEHAKKFDLAPDYYLTLYQVYPFMQSAVVVECEGIKLFNANDAKFLVLPLKQILNNHRKIDFVFRSPRSINSSACFDFMDAPTRAAENPEDSLRDFTAFVTSVGAQYAIPFASNHCYLHREVFHLNHTLVTPDLVVDYFQSERLQGPEIKVMVSGDKWTSEHGFSIADSLLFQDRELRLQAYAADQTSLLEGFYVKEAKADISLAQVEEHFRIFIRSMPWLIRRFFKNHPVTYVLMGKRDFHFWVDIFRGTIREVGPVEDAHHPLQIHTSAYIFRHCMALNLFHSLSLSKRVLYRCHQKDAKYLRLLELLFNAYEYGILPLHKLFAPKFIGACLPRWREILVYGVILYHKGIGNAFTRQGYFGPREHGLNGSNLPPESNSRPIKKALKSNLETQI
jgi:UDP-MurNAc hydroxylase